MFNLQDFRKKILAMNESRYYTYDFHGNFWCKPLKLEPCDPYLSLSGMTKSAKEWNQLAFGELK